MFFLALPSTAPTETWVSILTWCDTCISQRFVTEAPSAFQVCVNTKSAAYFSGSVCFVTGIHPFFVLLTKNAAHHALIWCPTWQFGERRSQSRIVLSRDPEIKVSSTGDIERATTLQHRCTKSEWCNTYPNSQAQAGNCQEWLYKVNQALTVLNLTAIIISIFPLLSPNHTLPFCMPREIPNVFVVMQGEVSDCIWKHEQTISIIIPWTQPCYPKADTQ